MIIKGKIPVTEETTEVAPYTETDCIRDTQEHIDTVRTFMEQCVANLSNRAEVHDASKLKSPELEMFTKFTPKLKASTYGSEEYKGFLTSMGEALKHHYENNSHHPEHYENGIRGMDLMDVVEMLCDWKAATMRHDNGDIIKSIAENQKRFGYSDEFADILRNTVERFGWHNQKNK